ncbi:MAG: YhgE/Pip family protein [Methanobacterium formicicum]
MIKKAIKIFKNDLRVVKNNPMVIMVLIVLICIPSLYTLLTVQSTWDPYTQTSNMKIAVVNEDAGYVLNGTQYQIGDHFVRELKNNKNFSWQFTDRETALDGVKTGKYYAALIIPGNFTENILSIDTTAPHKAQIEYIDNEKLNPIASKITGSGADALQVKINTVVVKTIDNVIFGKVKDVGELLKENKPQILKLKTFVNTLNGNLGAIDSKIAEANSMMGTVNEIWPKISASLPKIQENSNGIRANYDSLYAQIVTDPEGALTMVQNMESQVQETLITLEYQDAVLTSLYNATGDTQLIPIINEIEDNIGKANKVLALLKDIEGDIKNSRDPQSKLTQLKTLIDQMDDAINLLVNNKETINQKISGATAELNMVNSKWPELRSSIPLAAAKINSISEEDIDSLASYSDLDMDGVESYFEGPVAVEKRSMYPVDNYGSALAPFYMALSLWIGGIMAIALISMRVKSKKQYRGIIVYLGRMGLFVIISLFQGLLVALAVLTLGVQTSSIALLILTSMLIGLSFMIIVYSLTSAFGNAGKLLSVILLVVQITAAGGTFPVELLSSFSQALNPYIPLTYAITLLREVIAGVSWSNYWYCLGILALFPISTFLLTLLVKGKLDGRAESAEEKLKESGLF